MPRSALATTLFGAKNRVERKLYVPFNYAHFNILMTQDEYDRERLLEQQDTRNQVGLLDPRRYWGTVKPQAPRLDMTHR